MMAEAPCALPWHPQLPAVPTQLLINPPDSVAWLHSMFSLKSFSRPYLRRKPMVVAASLRNRHQTQIDQSVSDHAFNEHTMRS
jgi:hypothetical protein